MGGKDSKLSPVSYEDACKRVTDAELQRLKDAFKRSSTLSSHMTRNLFVREVLGDSVPPRLADHLFTAFGGTTKGLQFKDLLCGLVLITRGSQEERVKFLFGLFANESLTCIQKEEMDAAILGLEGQVPQALSDLFLESDRVSYEHFRFWVLRNADATTITKWLLKEPASVTLSNDLETPTFYQTLAGVTHLEESDITELEKRYWHFKNQSKTGLFDLETLKPIVSPPLPELLVKGLFAAFDENRDDHIDFKEMACGISACCRGPMLERQKFCFKIFDSDQDGLLSRKELEDMIAAMMVVRKENRTPEQLGSDGLDDLTPESLAETILNTHDVDHDDKITQEEYLVWTVSHSLPSIFLELLFQVCHVVLGLKPQCKEDEGYVIMKWLEREDRYGLQLAQVWYLVSMSWWHQWLEYIHFRPPYQTSDDSPVLNNNHDSLSKRSSGGRAGSLCPNLTRKSSITDESSVPMVPDSLYPSLPHQKSYSLQNSPVKYATVPRSGRPSEVRLNSSQVTYSASRSNHSTPTPSPNIARRNFASQKPGAIDNTPLIAPSTSRVSTLTNEGGRLQRDRMLARGRDFEILPEPVWKSLCSWYGGAPPLPRTVIIAHQGMAPELELYPINVRLFRHQNNNQRPPQPTTFSGMMGGIGGMVASTAGLSSQPTTPRRYLAYTAAFSRKHTLKQVYDFLASRLRINREDMRLWKFKDEHNMVLLEEEELTMDQLGITENMQLLIEVRNKDLTWPEEMSFLAKNKAAIDRNQQAPTEQGATGLSNLGNTCFMNSAVQCVSNTRILTLYFNGGMHLYELNRTNNLGMKGHIAQRYGELIKDLWSGTAKSIAPLKLRWTIGKYAPRFNGFQQHDSQEFLAFLLDGLHEDLNRVHNKPYVELKDSDGRPDEVVAKEAWDNHLLRNRSVVVDLFHGQLKSCVRCQKCGTTSVRFDPFTFLSLPLPMESCVHLEVIVMRLDGSTPTKFGLRLNMEEKYCGLKHHLNKLSGIPACQLLLVEILGAQVKSFPQDSQKIKTLLGGHLHAYEMPPSPPIPTMSHEEEQEMVSSSPAKGGLSQIQRMHPRPSPKASTAEAVISQEVVLSVGNGISSKALPSSSARPSQPPTSLVNGSANGSGYPGHHRNISNASSVASSTMSPTPEDVLTGFIVAVHRKMIRMDVYFLSSQKTRPSLIGVPVIVPCDERTRNIDLYRHVWTQVSRLVSPLPPSENNASNHAQDCDDSLKYEYPFTLKAVQKDGFTCAWCPWYRFCRGCKLECSSDLYNFGSSYIAIDWEPTALHLRYQSSQEKRYDDHPSVEEARKLQTEPIDLDTCLRAFTKEEELGEDELYYCSKCKEHQRASKTLQIWKLPPILIIHLKRFQFHNGRWVKSQKIVKFPMRQFDPANYIVKREPRAPPSDQEQSGSSSSGIDSPEAEAKSEQGKSSAEDEGICETKNVSFGAAVAKEAKEEDAISQGSMEEEEDYSNVEYNLYAMSSHSGILGGGHYVTYAKHPNEKWYLYNDSSCKEIPESQVDTNNAYILFYERKGLQYSRFMPDISNREPDTQEIDDEFESDLKKMCLIQ